MKESERIVRFAVVGTLNALVTAVVIWMLMDLFGCNYKVSNVAGYVVAQIHNFFWSKYWVFSSGRGHFMQEIPLFLLAFFCAYGMQFLSLLLMVEWMGINSYLAQFAGLFVYGAVNFVLNRRVTFRR